jgi:hypothetical protein
MKYEWMMIYEHEITQENLETPTDSGEVYNLARVNLSGGFRFYAMRHVAYLEA